MANIRQYFPPFMLDEKPKIVEFNTQEELLQIPFVRHFSINETTNTKDPQFYRYSLRGDMLMVEILNGDKAYAVGRVSDTSMLTLPERIEDK